VTLFGVALGGRIPAVYGQRYKCHNLKDGGRVPPATMLTTPRLLHRQWQAYRLRIAISAYPTCIRRHRLGGLPSEYCYAGRLARKKNYTVFQKNHVTMSSTTS